MQRIKLSLLCLKLILEHFQYYYKDVNKLKAYDDYCDTCFELKKDLHLAKDQKELEIMKENIKIHLD